jgi:hypothetical protein
MLLSNSAGHGVGAGSEIGREEEVAGGGREAGGGAKEERGGGGGGSTEGRLRACFNQLGLG